MPDVIHQNFVAESDPGSSEKKSFEGDVEQLRQNITEKKNSPEYKNSSDKELIRQVIQPAAQKTNVSLPNVASQPNDQPNVIPGYLQNSSDEIKKQVNGWVEKVFQNGLARTVEEIKGKYDDPFFLDAFHDALTDKLYDELKKRGMI